MIRTAVNITGDAAVSTMIARSENGLDMYVFNNPDAGIVTDIDLASKPEKEKEVY